MNHGTQRSQPEGREIKVSREDASDARQPSESQGGEGREEKTEGGIRRPIEMSCEFAREALDYDPKTGDLHWKVRPLHHFLTEKSWKIFNTQFSGKKTGCPDGKGYLQVRFSRIGLFFSHRLGFLIHHGWVPDLLDHKDGIGTHNWISNLRPATATTNMYNRKMQRRNTSGIIGVSWSKACKKWVAEIRCDNQKIHLGVFLSIEDAQEARKQAEIRYHGGFSLQSRTVINNTSP